jgi:hypothetical protein
MSKQTHSIVSCSPLRSPRARLHAGRTAITQRKWHNQHDCCRRIRPRKCIRCWSKQRTPFSIDSLFVSRCCFATHPAFAARFGRVLALHGPNIASRDGQSTANIDFQKSARTRSGFRFCPIQYACAHDTNTVEHFLNIRTWEEQREEQRKDGRDDTIQLY